MRVEEGILVVDGKCFSLGTSNVFNFFVLKYTFYANHKTMSFNFNIR